MKKHIRMKILKTVGGDFNCYGNEEMSEKSLPNLETVRGRLIIAGAGFKALPKKLKEVSGDVVVSKDLPNSLLQSIEHAQEAGIVKGDLVYFD